MKMARYSLADRQLARTTLDRRISSDGCHRAAVEQNRRPSQNPSFISFLPRFLRARQRGTAAGDRRPATCSSSTFLADAVAALAGEACAGLGPLRFSVERSCRRRVRQGRRGLAVTGARCSATWATHQARRATAARTG
jgi:hypothetical protein